MIPELLARLDDTALFNWLWALILLAIGWVFGRWLTNLLERACQHTRLDPLVSKLITSSAQPLTMAAAVVAALEKVGAFSGGVMAVLGTAGLAIGLGLRSLLSNVAAGAVLLSLRPFEIGDYIELPTVAGRVRTLGLFATELDTADGQTALILNDKVLEGVVRNHSRQGLMRVEVSLPLPAHAELDRWEPILAAAASSLPDLEPDHGVEVLVMDLQPDRTIVQLRAWTRSDQKERISAALRRRLLPLLAQPPAALAVPPPPEAATSPATAPEAPSPSPP
jgi:small conductance mechanosensitive channel